MRGGGEAVEVDRGPDGSAYVAQHVQGRLARAVEVALSGVREVLVDQLADGFGEFGGALEGPAGEGAGQRVDVQGGRAVDAEFRGGGADDLLRAVGSRVLDKGGRAYQELPFPVGAESGAYGGGVVDELHLGVQPGPDLEPEVEGAPSARRAAIRSGVNSRAV